MSSATSAGAKSAKKQAYFARLHNLVENHTQIMIVEADNVGSRQLAEIRFELRGRATLLMGKNTMMRTALRQKLETVPQLEALIPLIKENVGLVFCQADASEIRKVILEHRVPAPAKQGAIAPASVSIPPGPTGMDPGQTSFFQALQIATKIVKGQIEIQNEVLVIKEGERVTASQSVLLQKLNIRPFSYGLKTTHIYDNGSQYPASVLDIESSSLVDRLKSAIQTVAAVSLATSVPTQPSVPHSILAAFRQCAAIGLETDVIFDQMKALKEAIDNPDAFVAAAPAAAAATEEKPAEEAKAEAQEESDEEEEGGMFDLFGED
eukprot:Gregarina_sp_Poly_1__3447@NODE_19_length_21533_cov_161_091167_g17_i0_p10_GENE_NODE_19_length_21533_cov_161_091167_g17_i0NODE_19_length_21533_cov_161_091167_g17_i0_p10_ORF_typecomplete_len322_score83_43RL10P_insert/PF17777_1/4_4e23Ribosomal_L10/PF00466_20/1e22Ribosomal_60s/PF00428_19/1_8e04Ribosomal_60s/PF00428_19/3_8e03Ribosomal_60s/PF00428_19/1e10CsiD/PF08943_10/0_028USP19_linker/PF16602_5/0_2USP19_linker/PF16602_5/1_6e03_NODE_19_length_21533_cov_161_091167_g17_i01501115